LVATPDQHFTLRHAGIIHVALPISQGRVKEICKALMLLKSKGNLGSLIDLDETRSRPIKVVPQHETELGISQSMAALCWPV